MREMTLLAIVAAAALLGMGLGYLLLPKKPAPVVQVVAPLVPDAPAAALTKRLPAAEYYDPASTPEAIHAWRRLDKDAIEQRVAALSNADAEQLCFFLQLIPCDEVFDQINVKGRLNRHVDDIRMAAEFTDVEMAFRQLNDRH